MQHIKEVNKWRDIPCSWIGKLSIVQDIISFLIYSNSSQNPSTLLCGIDKLKLKFMWRGRRPWRANTVVKEKNKVRRLVSLNFKTHFFLLHLFISFLFKRFYLFTFRERGREKERGTSMCERFSCLWPTTQACALTGNWTSNLTVPRLALSPLNHTSLGCLFLIEGC